MSYLPQRDTANIREKTAKGSAPKPKRNQFLISLHKALQKKEYESALCWDNEGKAIVLKNPEAIADQVLTEEFSGMKFSSFIRQLSYYGFKRISQRSSMKVYYLEQFQRDSTRDTLKKIKRNHKDIESNEHLLEATTSTQQHEESDGVAAFMENKIAYLEAELIKMKAENVALRSCIRNLQAQREQQQSSQYIQSDFPAWNNENAGFSQTFFNPQMDNNMTYPIYGFPDENDATNPSNNSTFIEVYQPDCRGQKPYLADNLVASQSTGPYQTYPPRQDDGEENNFFNINDKATEDFWRMDMPTRNDW